MTLEGVILIVIGTAFILSILALYTKKVPKTLDKKYFVKEFRKVQKSCSNKDTWPLAIINADKLLDEALIRVRVKGETMGERMVEMQKKFTDNDSVWAAHKIRNRLVHETGVKLTKIEVEKSLKAYRQALKDIKAI